MNKGELIEKVAAETGASKAQVGEVLAAITDAITASLKKKKAVAMVGFGTFDVQKRKARIGHNPATGEKIKIKAQTVVKFRPGKALKDTVNK
jgi:DNA-binding protein HU-beta